MRVCVLVARQHDGSVDECLEVVAVAVGAVRSGNQVAAHVEAEAYAVAPFPATAQREVCSALHLLHAPAVDATLRSLAPARDAQAQGECLPTLRCHQYLHVAVPWEVCPDLHFHVRARLALGSDASRIIQVHDGTLPALHGQHEGDIGQPHGTVQVAACHGPSVEVPSPAVVRHLLAVEQVHVAEAVARGLHGSQQAVIDIAFDEVHRLGVARQAQHLGAELHPRHADARLHHACLLGICLFEACVAPRLAIPLGKVGLVGPAVAQDGQLAVAHALVHIPEALHPSFVARRAIIFGQPLKDGEHLVGLRIDVAHEARPHSVIRLLEEVAASAAALLYDVGGKVQVLLLAREEVEAHHGFQER